MIKNYGHTVSWNVGEPNRITVRIICRCSKSEFCRRVANHENGCKHWVSERVCETGNHFELDLLSRHPEGSLITYNEKTKDIIELLRPERR